MAAEGTLGGLDGQKIPVLGRTMQEIKLGKTMTKQQVWIARIQEECILEAPTFWRKKAALSSILGELFA